MRDLLQSPNIELGNLITEYQINEEQKIDCDYPIFGQQFPQGTGATKLLPGHLK